MVIDPLSAKAHKLLQILAEPLWRRALVLHNVAAAVEHVPALRRMGQLNTIVDVGANRGQFALAARRCFPGAQIVSFEPLVGAAEVYRAVFVADRGARLHEAAIAPESCDGVLHLSALDDSSSLLPIGSAQRSVFPGTAEIGTQRVEVARLSGYLRKEAISRPALLKLDVQGFELNALHACEPLLEHFKWIYAECSFVELYEGQALADELIVWLRNQGLPLRGVYNVVYDSSGETIQADCLFGRP